jgi:hypothetical protein
MHSIQFNSLMHRIGEVKSIKHFSEDGALLFSVLDSSVTVKHSGAVPVLVEQLGKAGGGKLLTLSGFTKDTTWVNFSFPPIVVSIEGTSRLNVGLLRSMRSELSNMVGPLCARVTADLREEDSPAGGISL